MCFAFIFVKFDTGKQQFVDMAQMLVKSLEDCHTGSLSTIAGTEHCQDPATALLHTKALQELQETITNMLEAATKAKTKSRTGKTVSLRVDSCNLMLVAYCEYMNFSCSPVRLNTQQWPEAQLSSNLIW